MSDKLQTKTRIMDAAESAIVQGGYNAFSFRDIAQQIGIKSASVHYHFPTKGDLAAAVMMRYREEFANKLVDPESEDYPAPRLLNGFIDGFKANIVDRDNMSLCTMLTTDKNLLPENAKQELEAFYLLKLNWLDKVVARLMDWPADSSQSQRLARQVLAALHGASVLVRATGNHADYEDAVGYLRQLGSS